MARKPKVVWTECQRLQLIRLVSRVTQTPTTEAHVALCSIAAPSAIRLLIALPARTTHSSAVAKPLHEPAGQTLIKVVGSAERRTVKWPIAKTQGLAAERRGEGRVQAKCLDLQWVRACQHGAPALRVDFAALTQVRSQSVDEALQDRRLWVACGWRSIQHFAPERSQLLPWDAKKVLLKSKRRRNR